VYLLLGSRSALDANGYCHTPLAHLNALQISESDEFPSTVMTRWGFDSFSTLVTTHQWL